MFANEPVLSRRITIDDQLFVQDLYGLDGFLFGKLPGGGNRVPIAAQQFAARRAAADPG
jgi:hypothetical protein